MVLRSPIVLGKLVNPSVVVARGTARIHLTLKTVRPAFGSHPRYWMAKAWPDGRWLEIHSCSREVGTKSPGRQDPINMLSSFPIYNPVIQR